MSISVDSDRSPARAITRKWWLPIVVGVAWLIYGMVVLSASVTSLTAVSLLFGVGMLGGAASEFILASVGLGMRWVHIMFGLISLAAGVVALAWPSSTAVVLAAVIAWFLLFDGVFEIVTAIMFRDVDELWWITLAIGFIEIVVAVWALGYAGRSVALLLAWVGIGAIARGVSRIMDGMTLHGADRQLRSMLTDSRMG